MRSYYMFNDRGSESELRFRRHGQRYEGHQGYPVANPRIINTCFLVHTLFPTPLMTIRVAQIPTRARPEGFNQLSDPSLACLFPLAGTIIKKKRQVEEIGKEYGINEAKEE